MKRFLSCVLLLLIILIVPRLIVFADEKDILFTSEYCLECRNLDDDILEACKENNIEIILIDTEEGAKKFEEFTSLNGIEKGIPLLYYGGNVYNEPSSIQYALLGNNMNPFIFSLLGFLDGLNPCAISVLMIFISLLVSIGLNKKSLLVGLFFIIGETLSNFLLGFGILKVTESLYQFNIVLNIIYILSILICIYIFVINSIDIYNGFRKNNVIKNQLSDNIKYKSFSVISKHLFSKFLLFIALIMGFIIAVLEFGCTGQLYLPSILNMNGSIFYLVIYNLFFALPLIIVLIIAYLLNKPEQIKEFIMKKSYLLKIILNIVIVILCVQIILKLI